MPSDWTIAGAGGEPIIGNTHRPAGPSRGTIILAHGFKGYKDYGMFPRLAAAFAEAGFTAHRFNFSHSGMTDNVAKFERPDLFERDTWNKQVFDLRAVIEAAVRRIIGGDELGSRDRPTPKFAASEGGESRLSYLIFGHSRGGASALLTAGRFVDDDRFPQPCGVIAAAAPSRCNPLSDEESQLVLAQGWIESPSSRTGQRLRVGKAFLQEQLDEPERHDLRRQAARIRCPLLIVHGDADTTVPVAAANDIADAAESPVQVKIIAGGDHVFNTPNPMPETGQPSPPLQQLIDAVLTFAKQCTPKRSGTHG